MKNPFKKTITKSDDLMIDDHIKVAGCMYRITGIEKVGDSYVITFHSIVNRKYTGILTFKRNTLMTIWNQR